MALTLIDTDTATGTDATLGFTSGIDDTYSVYEFHFVNMHPVNNQVDFGFQVNAHDGSSQLTGFNETIQSTAFYVQHGEGDGAGTSIDYQASYDQAGGTGYQALNYETGSDADQSVSGILTLYDPSNTTYVKQWTARAQNAQSDDYSVDMHTAGYINTTNAITQISFKFDTGAIQAGTIKMFGVS